MDKKTVQTITLIVVLIGGALGIWANYVTLREHYNKAKNQSTP